MEEKNLRKCKQCNEVKYRILDGKYDSINKRWRDQTGKTWNGSVCPECHIKQQKEKQRLRRSQ